ncbi:MAG: sigma-70 family RNA polymerase sigma factor [Candidatus Latescibacteria bacterium]|nr:sigma-70 family RNA polymerase sigma factor [Candidatus Latescibacterota bacterium]
MTRPSDKDLAQQVRQGDEQAFIALIRRHERVLAALIGYRIGTDDQVKDVLQETLIHAWSALRRETPRNVRAWLLQVARNRCRDYFRSTQRRELFVESNSLAPMVNRLGVAQARQRQAAVDIVEAMEEVPAPERAALQAFYLDGLSIAEIAARHRCPSGTIKRRLSHGRDQIRAVLGVTRKPRRQTMSTERDDKQQPFPQYRPDIRIEPSRKKPFRIDFREMTWWFVVPEVGDRVRYAWYEPLVAGDEAWRLSQIASLEAVCPAVIHGRPCVQIEVANQHFDRTGMTYDKTPGPEKGHRVRVWGCSSEEEVEWLAVETLNSDGSRELMTFLDEDFHYDWGPPSQRAIEDNGCLREEADGSFSRRTDVPAIMGAGVFEVHVGAQHFTCLRVFDVEKEATERDVMVEAYITREGRSILFRRYNGDRWAKGDAPPHNFGSELTWSEDLPHANRLIIDGVTYVHHYDNLTDVACGLAD